MADDDKQQDGDNTGGGLRAQLEKALEENRTLKGTIRESAFKQAGFDPNEGPGALIAKTYDGEATVEGITEFAKQYGLAPNAGKQQSSQTEGEDQPTPEQLRAQGEGALDQVAQGTVSSLDPSIDDKIAKAEAEGDWDTFNRLSAQKLEASRR